ncbi:MAG TPA: TlpA disulfide reductase family protein [Verrucomicrobiae bacterium]|nr:TlpA disulfide reductase family protein [Verrucomicrobiae bacterium]
MKTKILIVFAAASLVLSSQFAFAADTNTTTTELKALVTKIQTKIRAGQTEEKDFGPELKEFDTLLAKHKSEKTDAVANILLLKSTLYLEVFNDPDKAKAAVERLKKDFPDTKAGQNADRMIAMIDKQSAAMKIQNSLAVGTKFPDFSEKDVNGKPLSITNYKGKVVLLDFWATWCGPCVAELPNVIKTYKKHHGDGFEIIGISLDDDQQKLETFTKQKNMTWQQYFDGKGWGNKLAVKYGVQAIPATFLLDGNGKIIGKNLRGEALEDAVNKALAKN